ncbi:MAG: hypothetical protein WBJ21_01495 [Burkholderiaceae bacterium]
MGFVRIIMALAGYKPSEETKNTESGTRQIYVKRASVKPLISEHKTQSSKIPNTIWTHLAYFFSNPWEAIRHILTPVAPTHSPANNKPQDKANSLSTSDNNSLPSVKNDFNHSGKIAFDGVISSLMQFPKDPISDNFLDNAACQNYAKSVIQEYENLENKEIIEEGRMRSYDAAHQFLKRKGLIPSKEIQELKAQSQYLSAENEKNSSILNTPTILDLDFSSEEISVEPSAGEKLFGQFVKAHADTLPENLDSGSVFLQKECVEHAQVLKDQFNTYVTHLKTMDEDEIKQFAAAKFLIKCSLNNQRNAEKMAAQNASPKLPAGEKLFADFFDLYMANKSASLDNISTLKILKEGKFNDAECIAFAKTMKELDISTWTLSEEHEIFQQKKEAANWMLNEIEKFSTPENTILFAELSASSVPPPPPTPFRWHSAVKQINASSATERKIMQSLFVLNPQDFEGAMRHFSRMLEQPGARSAVSDPLQKMQQQANEEQQKGALIDDAQAALLWLARWEAAGKDGRKGEMEKLTFADLLDSNLKPIRQAIEKKIDELKPNKVQPQTSANILQTAPVDIADLTEAELSAGQASFNKYRESFFKAKNAGRTIRFVEGSAYGKAPCLAVARHYANTLALLPLKDRVPADAQVLAAAEALLQHFEPN